MTGSLWEYRVLDREQNGWFDVLRRRNDSSWERIASVWGESRANWLAFDALPQRDREISVGLVSE